MHGHLPFLLSRAAPLLRHVSHFYHSATRLFEVGLYSLQMPRRESERRRRQHSAAGRRRGNIRPRLRPLLVHYHIFKNAGTSFQFAMQQAIGTRLHIYDASTADGIVSPADVARFAMSAPRVTAIFSHHAVLPPPSMRRRAVIGSILIRDPIARIRSIYAFERQQSRSTPGAVKAKALDFKGYVEWRLSCSTEMFCNYQVYFCSRHAGQKQVKKITEAHLQCAIENLDCVDLLGTVERYGEWLTLVQMTLSKVFPGLTLVAKRENVSGAGVELSHAAILHDLVQDLGPDLASRLLECNELDMRLHQVADASLNRQLAEHTAEVALVRHYQRARETGLSNNQASGSNT